MPRRVEGRERIRTLLSGGAGLRRAGRLTGFGPIAVLGTTDPEVIVAEFEVHGERLATGEPFRFSNLQVIRVRKGEILSLRDYWSPLDRVDLQPLEDPA